MTRALGVDLGTVRIGLASSDPTGLIASPLGFVRRSRDRRRDHKAIADHAAEIEAEVVVVGLPRSLDGHEGEAAVNARAEADELAAVVKRPVEVYDERLTSVIAERTLISQGVRRDKRKQVVDSVAAAVMLQGWLDARRNAR